MKVKTWQSKKIDSHVLSILWHFEFSFYSTQLFSIYQIYEHNWLIRKCWCHLLERQFCNFKHYNYDFTNAMRVPETSIHTRNSANTVFSSSSGGIGCVGVIVCNVRAPALSTTQYVISGGSSSYKVNTRITNFRYFII